MAITSLVNFTLLVDVRQTESQTGNIFREPFIAEFAFDAYILRAKHGE